MHIHEIGYIRNSQNIYTNKQKDENLQLSPQEKEKNIKEIQKQMERLENQAPATAEKPPVVSSKKVQALQDVTVQQKQSYDIKKRFDTFEHQPKSETSGIYAVSHDVDGTPTIKFDDVVKEGIQASPHTNAENENKPKLVKTTVNTDAVDREIEKLKKTLQETKQKLSSANNPETKEVLQNEIQALEAELKQKDNDTYRRQHMQITEQKEVSNFGA